MITSEKGLTLTNAGFMCAKAADRKTEAEALLNNLTFLDCKLGLIGSEKRDTTQIGLKDFSEINKALETISEMNGFIAYFAEGRKALEAYKKSVLRYTFEEYVSDNEIELPERPVQKRVEFSNMEDVIDEMNIADKVMYYSLDAEAGVYGTYIHDGKISKAREELHKRLQRPVLVDEDGRDTLIHEYSASIDKEIIDTEFEALQNKYREVERKVNKMKSDLRETLRIRNAEETVLQNKYNDEYANSLAEYNLKMENIRNRYNQFLRDEEARVSKLKIEIPKRFESLVAEWS